MNYFKLGQTGLSVSRLCLGTMNFGMVSSKKECFKMLDMAIDYGINFIDTSNSYGGYTNRGESERIIGEWISLNQSKRNRIFLATKVYSQTEEEFRNPNDEKGLSRYKVRHHLKKSLERLRTDHIELYQMHHIDRNCSYEDLVDTFYREFMTGRIDYIGSSNFTAFDLAMFQSCSNNRKIIGLVSEQHKYNLMSRWAELEVLPATKKLGISFLAWGPLNAGLLSNNAFSLQQGTRAPHNKYTPADKLAINKFQKICTEFGLSCQFVAMAWLLHNSEVDGIVIGPRDHVQLLDYINALNVKLDEDMQKQIDEIFPPIGNAPECYAW